MFLRLFVFYIFLGRGSYINIGDVFVNFVEIFRFPKQISGCSLHNLMIITQLATISGCSSGIQ